MRGSGFEGSTDAPHDGGIASETIASFAGLGHHIVDLAENMDTARMFAYIVFVIVIVAFLNAIVSKLEGKARWR